MADQSFSPDILLVVGADIAQLREQLATIQREFNIPPIEIKVEASTQQINEITKSVNQAKKEIESVAVATDKAEAGFAKWLSQLRQVRVDTEALANRRYLISPEAFQQNEAGLQRINQAFATISETIKQVEAGTALGAAEWQRYREALTLVGIETDRVTQGEKVLEESRAASLKSRMSQLEAEKQLRSEQIRDAGRLADQNRILIAQAEKLLTLTRETPAIQGRAASLQSSIATAQLQVAGGKALEPAQLTQIKTEMDAIKRSSDAILESQQANAASIKVEEQNIADLKRGYQELERTQLARAKAQEASNLKQIDQQTVLINLQKELDRIARAQPSLRGQVTPVQSRAENLQTQIAVSGLSPKTTEEVALLRKEVAGLNKEAALLPPVVKDVDNTLTGVFGKFGGYVKSAALLTIAYGGIRAVIKGAEDYIELDRALARVSATMSENADRAVVVGEAYNQIVKANQTLGTSFADAGKVVFELQKVLGNNAEQINAAFLPALTLLSIGEGNQTEILRTLIGLQKVYGDTLGDTSPQQQYLAIADKLIAASAASIQDIDGFRVALQNVAPVAKQAGLTLDQTEAALVVLTNGMQSASRAGTGLRQLLVDLQTRPAAISKIFDIPFDPDKPLNAIKLLEQVVTKVREIGTESLKSQAMIQAAFPDKRAALPFETLVELFPQYKQALDEIERSSGRASAAQRELANSVGAALNRLQGSLFVETLANLKAAFDISPGQSKPLVDAIDAVRLAILAVSEATQTAIIRIRQLLAIPIRGAEAAAEKITGQPGALGRGATALGQATQKFLSNPLAVLDPRGLLPTETEEKIQAELARLANQVFSEAILKTIRDLEKQTPESRRAETAQDIAFQARQSDLAAANPPDTRSRVELKKITDELAEAEKAYLNQVRLEVAIGDQEASYNARIAAAQGLLAIKIKETNKARQDYLTTASIPGKEVADLEQYKGKYFAALEAQRHAEDTLNRLRHDAKVADQKEIAATNALIVLGAKGLESVDDKLRNTNRDLAKLQLSDALKRSFADANFSVEAFDDAVQKTKDSIQEVIDLQRDKLADQLKINTPDGVLSLLNSEDVETLTSKYGVALSDIQDRIKEFYSQVGQYSRRITKQMADDLDINFLTEAESALKKFFTDLSKAEALDAFGNGDSSRNAKIADKYLGVEKLNQELILSQATLGKWGAEAEAATELAKFGFVSVADAIEKLGADNPKIKIIIEALDRLKVKYTEVTTSKAGALILNEERELKAVQDAYGKTGAEAEKYNIALKVEKEEYDKLLPAQQAQVNQLARIAETRKAATAASGLKRLGFSKEDAEQLARIANETSDIENQVNAGLAAIEKLLDKDEALRQLAERALQDSARATGDFVTYFISKMRDGANAAGEFWKSFGELADSTLKNVSSALSDLFFDIFTHKTNSAKEVWKNFLNSMLRAISDFLSQQAVKALLNLLSGTGGSGVSGIFGGTSSSGLNVGAISKLATSVISSYVAENGGVGADVIPTDTLGMGGGAISGVGGAAGIGGVSYGQLGQLGLSLVGQGTSAVTGGAGIVSGVANATTNFAGNGVTGVLFGLPATTTGGTLVTFVSGAEGATALGAEGLGAAVESGAFVAEGIGASTVVGGTTTSATSGLIGVGGSISSATVVLAALAAAYEIYTGVTAIEENRGGTKGYNAGVGGLSGVAGGAIIGGAIGAVAYGVIGAVIGAILGAAVGGAVGGTVGGFIGVDPEETTHYRIRAEQARAFQSAGGSLKGIADTRSPQAFTDYLIQLQSGYVGGKQGVGDNAIAIGFRNLTFTPQQFLDAVTRGLINFQTGITKPTTPEQLTAAVAAGTIQGLRLVNGQIQATLGIGRPNDYYTTLTGRGFQEFYNQIGGATTAKGTGPQPLAELYALLQQGLDRNALDPANNAIIQAIKNKFDTLALLNLEINKALNEVLKQTITPASASVSDLLIAQAKQFRQTLNGLIAANAIEISNVVEHLRASVDPVEILSDVDKIKTLIESRYNDEIELVRKFADQLDQLAQGFRNTSAAVQDQIDALNASNLGPTNPLQAYQRAQQRFGEAREAFFKNPSPETAAAVQKLVDPLLQAAGQVFTRPSTQYQDIFQNTINTLEEIKGEANRQVDSIQAALTHALGTSNSIQELVEKNTAQMANDMKLLRQLAEARLTELGFTINNSTLTPQQIQEIQNRVNQTAMTPVANAPTGGVPPGSNNAPSYLGPIYQGGGQSGEQTDFSTPMPVFGSALGPGQYFNKDSEGRAIGTVQFSQELYDQWVAYWRSQGYTTPPITAQAGARYTREGLYYLHEGERVLPRYQAEASRRGELGGISASLTIAPGAIIINGATDPNATGKAVVDLVETSIRTGRLGRVISERVRAK